MAAPRRVLAPGPRRGSASIPAPGSLGLSGGAITLLVAALGVIWAWWAWRRGAFFGTALYPGAIAIFVLIAFLLRGAPLRVRLRGAPLIALLALLGLAGWSLASMAWSPAPEVALQDAERIVVYAVAFALGLWLSALLGRRMLLAAVPLAAGAAIVALATLFSLGIGDDVAEYLEPDATLRYPLGYRNAVAAFFLIALWPMVGLAASRSLTWPARAALLASATLAIELAVLAQSRGSAFAIPIAALVFVAVSRERLRGITWLAIAVLPVLPALPALLDVFQAGGGNDSDSLQPLRAASTVMALTGLLSLVLGAIAVRLDARITVSREVRRGAGWGIALATSVAVLAGVVALATSQRGPVGFVDERLTELTGEGTPGFEESGSRFGLNLGSNRGDFWRVAWADARSHPLRGTGAGGFQFSYLRERDSDLIPDDPHSVELLLLSELGLPGLLLFAVFLAAAVTGALRTRRLGPNGAALAAIALAAAAYWVTHASIDWLWRYPALVAPVIALLGSACAPSALGPELRPPPAARRLGVAALVVVAASMLPLLFSERYTNAALREWRTDLDRAYLNLDRAQQLNPFADRPALAEAVIAESSGDTARALRALEEAKRRKPDFWGAYYLSARVLAPSDPAGAAEQLELARSLNPGSPEVERLERELERPPPGAGASSPSTR